MGVRGEPVLQMARSEARLCVTRGFRPRSSCTAIHLAEVPNTVMPHLSTRSQSTALCGCRGEPS